MTRHVRRFLEIGALTGALLVLGAGPAQADAAGPTDYRSEVTGIVPATAEVHPTIRGGDSFLEVTVAAGHTVIVEGYSGEPYLRFLPDGTVERNRLSSATYLNDDRKGRITIPAEVQAATEAGADPEWEPIAAGGTYAWHDHRVHWMAEVSPPVRRGERVTGAYDPWQVAITVDGAPAEIEGTLTYERSVSPLPWVAAALVAAGLLVGLGRRRGVAVPAAALLGVSAMAVVVGRAEWRATPDGGGSPLLWALPAIAALAAAAALVLARRGAGVVLTLATVAALSGWGLFRIDVLLKPVLPTTLPFALDRGALALAFGASVAGAYLALTSGVLTLPDLDDDDEDDDDGR